LGPGHCHDQETAQIAELAIGESQEAQFPQRIAAIAGNDMADVMQFAHAGAEQIDVGRHGIVLPAFRGLNQSFGRQFFLFHEGEIGAAQRTGRQAAQAFAIGQRRQKIAALGQHFFAQCALGKTAEGVDQRLAAHGAQDDKDLACVAGRLQHAKGAHRLERAQAG